MLHVIAHALLDSSTVVKLPPKPVRSAADLYHGWARDWRGKQSKRVHLRAWFARHSLCFPRPLSLHPQAFPLPRRLTTDL